MRCSKCGSEEVTAQGRCEHCGVRHTTHCPRCKQPAFEGANFCSGCGLRLGGGEAPDGLVEVDPGGLGTGASSRRGPTGLAGSRAAYRGERKRVTVLFADLFGSLSMIEGGDAEDVQSLLDAVVAVMTDAVHRYEGVVNQVLGDGIMALFGVPVAHEDHVVRAAHAALAMQAAVAGLRDAGWAERGLQPKIRVGLHAGDVAIRAVEGDLSTEYRAVGATTHIAARMEQLAPPGAVWTTAQTVALAGGLLRGRRVGPVEVKGVREPVEVVELVGISTRTRFRASAVRGLSPLVNRVETLGNLKHALGQVQAGESRVAALVGEPGVGKSRLCHELLATAPEECQVLEAAAVSFDRSAALGLLASMVRGLCGVDDDDDQAQVGDKAAALLMQLGEPLPRRLPAVLELLDVPSSDPEWRRLDPVQKRRQIEALLHELLQRFCARAPTVLLLEDLHWCDSDSLSVIAGLVERLPAQTLLLLTWRPELGRDWADLSQALYCQVVPLALSESEILLTSLLGREATPGELLKRLVERTDGNPFFIEESVRSLSERGVLRESQEVYQASRESSVDVPANVEALLDSRLDRLPEEALDVLQAAAVIGDDCSADVLAAVAGLSGAALQARVPPLLDAQLLLETVQGVRDAAEGVSAVYRFKHTLIQDVAYRRLVRGRKKELHGRVLSVLEKQKSRAGERVERLAQHAYRAEAWERCVEYQVRACVRAAGRSANQQAIKHLERGLEVVARLPAGAERSRAEVDIRLTALAPLLPLGDHRRALELLREAEGHARELGDDARLAKVLSQISAELWLIARYDEGERAAQQALELADGLGERSFPLQSSARYNLAMIKHGQGRYAEALAIMCDLQARFEGALARRRLGWAGYPSVLVRTFVIANHVFLGDFKQARRAFEQGRALAEELDHPFSRTMILEQHGLCLLVQGDVEGAARVLQQALSVCEREQVHTMYVPIVSHLGLALVRLGKQVEGRALLEQTARRDLQSVGHYAVDYLFIGLSEACLRDGELDCALEHAERVAQDALRCGEHGMTPRAQLQRAAVLTAMTGRHDDAAAAIERAHAEAERLDMTPWIALSHHAHARLLRARGQAEQARAQWRQALPIWQRLDAPLRVAEVERALASG